MFYISSVNFDEDLVAVTNTNDNSTEWHTTSDAVAMDRRGLGVYGIFADGRIQEVSREDAESIYIGDYLGEAEFNVLVTLSPRQNKSKGTNIGVAYVKTPVSVWLNYSQYFTDFKYFLVQEVNKDIMKFYEVLQTRSPYSVVSPSESSLSANKIILWDVSTQTISGDNPVNTYTVPEDISNFGWKDNSLRTGKIVKYYHAEPDSQSQRFKLVLCRFYNSETRQVIFLVARTYPLSKQTYLMENNGLWYDYYTFEKLKKDLQTSVYINVTQDTDGFTYSGIDGRIRFDYNTMNKVYGRYLTKETNLRRLKNKLTNKQENVIYENGEALELYINSDGELNIPEGCRVAFNTIDNTKNPLTSIVIPSTFERGNFRLTAGITPRTSLRVETHCRRYEEVCKLLFNIADACTRIYWQKSEPVSALCLLTALYAGYSREEQIYYLNKEAKKSGFRKVVLSRGVFEEYWGIMLRDSSNFKLLKGKIKCSSVLGRDLISQVRCFFEQDSPYTEENFMKTLERELIESGGNSVLFRRKVPRKVYNCYKIVHCVILMLQTMISAIGVAKTESEEAQLLNIKAKLNEVQGIFDAYNKAYVKAGVDAWRRYLAEYPSEVIYYGIIL